MAQGATEKDVRFYLQELQSEECQCGRWKKPGYSFCFICYRRLPRDMQRALYRRVFDGYEEAYEEAVAFLTD